MVSIIIITHNRKEELFRAIDSCFRQTYKDYEIIIIDNASDMDISNQIAEHMEKYKFNNYEYCYQEYNLGVAGGRNLGFKKASGEYCFFLDDDAVLNNEDSFELAIEDFNSDDRVAAIACEIYQPLDNTYLSPIHIDKNNVLTYIGAAHFIKKEFWQEKMLYPDNIIYGSEEMYVGLYVLKNDNKIIYDNKIKVNHLPSTIHRVEGKERDFNIIINTYICRKYFYPKGFLPLLDLAFYLHLIGNRLYKNSVVKNELKTRYRDEYENRMTIYQFIKCCRCIKLRNVF